MTSVAWCAAIAWIAAAGPPAANGQVTLYTLAIGYNGLPAAADPVVVQPLRFADDDAARMYTFGREAGRSARLLALLDEESARRFPELVSQARPPTLVELRRAVSELNREMDAARAAGRQPAVILYYSGHGTRREDGEGTLALLDGEITQRVLYEELLATLHASFVHLLIDACHAEATVHPRDAQAATVEIPRDEVAGYLARTTLARFPHVGTIMASTQDAQTHEWEVYQGGVFTHEVLSGLRGGADVDGDRRIEYSEMAAFLAAANGAVTAPQARLRTVVRPPPANARAPLVDLAASNGGSWLEGRPAVLGSFYLEDGRGERIADLRIEQGVKVALLVPADRLLYVRANRLEAEIRLARGERREFATLAFGRASLRSRGALESSFRRGLFATAFGPAYYRGFVDRDGGLVPVEIPAPDLELAAPAPSPQRGPALMAFGLGGAFSVAAISFGVISWSAHRDYRDATLERAADAAHDRYQRNLTGGLISAGAALLSAGVGLWLWRREH